MKWKIKEDRFNIYIPMFKEKWYKRWKYLSKQDGEYIIHKSFDSYWADPRVELMTFKWDALLLIEEFIKSQENK